MSQPFTRLTRRRPFRRSTSTLVASDTSNDDLVFTPDGLGRESYVEIVLAGPIDPSSGMIMDLALVDAELARTLGPLEASDANTPSTELVATHLFETLRERFEDLARGVRLEKLRLGESADAWVDVWP